MARLKQISPTLNTLCAKLVHERHQVEAQIETRLLRQTIERLLQKGVGVAEVLTVLGHDHWESRLAKQLTEHGLVE